MLLYILALTFAVSTIQAHQTVPAAPPPAVVKQVFHTFESTTGLSWVPWIAVANESRSLTRAEVAAVILHGEDVGCGYPPDRIVIDDQEVIDKLKAAADNAQRVDEDIPLPGVSFADEIAFVPTERKINQDAKHGVPRLVSFGFNPRWEVTSLGPEFRKALNVYQAWYIETIRYGLARLVPERGSAKANVDSIVLEYLGGSGTILDKPDAISEFCRAAPTADSDIYDLYGKHRYPVVVRVYRNKQVTSYYLMLRPEEPPVTTAFAHLVYKYAQRDSGYFPGPATRMLK